MDDLSKQMAEMSLLFSILCSLWLFMYSTYGSEYSHVTSFGGENCTVRWKFNNETEIFYFEVSAKATGWVGFGFSRLLFPDNANLQWNRNSMDHYDVIVGGVFNGTVYYEVSLNFICFCLIRRCIRVRVRRNLSVAYIGACSIRPVLYYHFMRFVF